MASALRTREADRRAEHGLCKVRSLGASSDSFQPSFFGGRDPERSLQPERCGDHGHRCNVLLLRCLPFWMLDLRIDGSGRIWAQPFEIVAKAATSVRLHTGPAKAS